MKSFQLVFYSLIYVWQLFEGTFNINELAKFLEMNVSMEFMA